MELGCVCGGWGGARVIGGGARGGGARGAFQEVPVW